MSDPVTLEDIYALFQRSQEETERRAAEADRRAAEADRRAAEFDRRIAASKAEADRRAAEAAQRAADFDRRMAESKADFDRRMVESKAEADRRAAEAAQRAADFDRRMVESKAEADHRAAEAAQRAADFDRRMAESKAEADRRAAEAEVRLARAEAIAAQANQAVNSLSSRWGRFVENLVAPAALRLFQDQGIAVQELYQRVRSARGERHLEVDILAVDDDVAVVIEVKSRLTQENVRRCLQNLEQFKTAFPHYATYQLYGAVAAIEIDGDVDTYAYKQGLFVIQQSGDSVEISNTPDFIPRTW